GGAGRPVLGVARGGSCEGWSALVRSAVAWVGLPDPGLTRRALASAADTDANALRGLIDGWARLDDCGRGLTAAAALDLLKADLQREPAQRRHADLMAVLSELYSLRPGDLPDARKLGRRLQLWRRGDGGRA